MSNPSLPPSADAVEAAKERLTRVVQGDALRDVYPRGTQPSDFHADIRTLFSALGSEGEDSKIARLKTALDEYRDALVDAADVFESYADAHAAKGGPDAEFKADVNRKLARRFRNLATRSVPTDLAALSTPGDANGQ